MRFYILLSLSSCQILSIDGFLPSIIFMPVYGVDKIDGRYFAMQKKRTSLAAVVSPYLYIAPVVVFLAVFTIYPILRSVYLSFFRTDAVFSFMRFVGLDYYREIFSSALFWQVFQNTILYGALQVILTTVLGMACALIANSKQVRFRTLFKVSMFYPYILPWTVAAMVWIYMYHPTRGVVNSLLGMHVEWLNSYDITLYALVIVCVWKTVGFNFLLFLSGLQLIPSELYEVMKMDSNSACKMFRHITLPMLSPTTFVAVLLSIVGSFQSVDLIYIMTSGRPGNSTNTLIYYIYQQGIVNWKIGFGSALSTILFLALLIFTVVYIVVGERKINYER